VPGVTKPGRELCVSLADQLILAEKMDRQWGWDSALAMAIAMLVLIGLRNILRKNLYDTGRGPLDK
jgi:hypothetical protein